MQARASGAIPNTALTPPVLQVRDLHVAFPTQDGVVQAVAGLTLDIAPGEIVGLVGESGCGKSTAALTLMGLLQKPGRITGGEILLDGRNIVPLAEREMRMLRGPKVAMIFQDALAALDPRMRVGRQITEPLEIHMRLSGKAARQRAIELLAAVGIPSPAERIDQYPHEFSGGMRQRAMIAVALACNPRLLIADEPTTALDVIIQRQILDLILRLRDETGAGVLMITHDVGVVAELCDRVVVMYAGRAVETGATQQVFTRAAHPYTSGLLGSTLDLESDRDQPLRAIPGLPPDLIHLPPGCVFAPRCPRVSDQCRLQPALEFVDTDHATACWHWREELAHGIA